MKKIAVLIPCYNEELTVGKVVRDFKKELPTAKVYVYDNNSTDNTAKIAEESGATVKRELRQGKGNVVRTMFREVNADIYVMVDGDDTYPAESVHDLIKPIVTKQAEMVVGDRHSSGAYASENKRPMHNFGNIVVTYLINLLFNSKLKDVMSGYRVFNNTFVKNVPIISRGFSVETEMSLIAVDNKFLIDEIPVEYRDRPEGSISKLNTIQDGLIVMKTIVWIFKDYKPLIFFGIASILFAIAGLLTGIPVVIEFVRTGLIAKIPSAILATGLELCAGISMTVGLILDTVVKHHKMNYELLLTKSFKE